MKEFAQTAKQKITQLEANEHKAELVAAADDLATRINAMESPESVGTAARALANHLLQAYPVASTPPVHIDTAKAKQLYQENCAACHGLNGHGDGPLAANLPTPPIAFADPVRAAQRSPFALQQIITQGIEGTPMVGFTALPEADRWALAFYVSQLAFSVADQEAGKSLWNGSDAIRAQIPNIDALAGMTQVELATRIGDDARPVLAYLRNHVDKAALARGQGLTLAKLRLHESYAAFTAGNKTAARDLALSAYLDGVEPVEPTIATRDSGIRTELETAMSTYRTMVTENVETQKLTTQLAAVNAVLDKAELLLSASEASPTTTFVGSLTILLREGLEALLMVVTMLAFLGKTAREDQLPYVHAGWIGALVAGAVTWAVATYLIGVSGASRELTEGFSSLFAALVLLGVGMWMHRKSVAGRWQEYFNAKLTGSLKKRSAYVLFGLSFIAVYREVFETILFYAALWQEGNHFALTLGLIVGLLLLLVLAVWMLRYSKRLPIGRFLSVSSILVAVLAVVLAGKGIAGFQEAGILNIHSIPVPRISLLGIFPTVESVLAQVIVAVLAMVGYYLNNQPSSSKAVT
ncbi:cytochrome c/FTR1 family iron permease [Cellvibrio zantedeschiae]|nr:cytochrome c/FTR1 family iron permease [Cellvibrio zantedeschiae]